MKLSQPAIWAILALAVPAGAGAAVSRANPAPQSLPPAHASALSAAPLAAQSLAPVLTYADLADLADAAPLVLRAQVRRVIPVEPERSAGLRPGRVRLYVEARVEALLAGDAVLGESQRYLVDVPLDSRGRPPALKRRSVLLFARTVPARPGELQLVAPDAQVLWDAAIEARLRGVLGELLATGAPPRISAVREAIFVPGTLAGEGETQMFLATRDESPAAIIVNHRPGQPPSWGVTFSEVLDSGARPPVPETLAWYRLACFLPPELPPRVNVSGSGAEKAQAAADYRLVLGQLGGCPRTRGN